MSPAPPLVRPVTDRDVAADTAAWELRCLSHYRPDYPYQPERYAYTETDTTDPYYVVWDVRILSPSIWHDLVDTGLAQALPILATTAGLAREAWHTSGRVMVAGIPAALFVSTRHTCALRPDRALWPGPRPPGSQRFYAFDPQRVPLVVAEVVSHETAEVRDHDWIDKYATYARMGIREYWLLDETLDHPLCINTLDTADGVVGGLSAYRRLVNAPDGGVRSPVLGRTLRWHIDHLQYWDVRESTWGDMIEILVRHRQAAARAEGRARGAVVERIGALVALVQDAGALARPAERAHYRDRLRTLELAQLPTIREGLEHLRSYPEGPSRATAAVRWLDRYLPSADPA